MYGLGPQPLAIVWPDPARMRESSPDDFEQAIGLLATTTYLGGQSSPPEAPLPSEILFVMGAAHPLATSPTARAVGRSDST